MSRRRSAKVAARNEALLARIKERKKEQPFLGYRQMWAQLRFKDGHKVNPKRVYRLMLVHGLLCAKNQKLRAERSSRPKPRPTRPNEWWGIDMTKSITDSGWVYTVLVKDWYTKKIVGSYAGTRSRTEEWKAALNAALNRQFPEGVRGQGLHLMSDNGSQPTSKSFTKYCKKLGIEQAFTSYNNPKGNADTERVMRTLKEQLVWLREWHSADELIAAIALWVEEYNEGHLHSALGYRTPNQVEQLWKLGHMTLEKAA